MPEVMSDVRRTREMSEAEFAARYRCDQFTATVLLNRLRYVTAHMSTGLRREAFSPVIQQANDFACAITGPAGKNYPLTVVSNSLALFLGTLTDAVGNAVEEYGLERLKPGDVLVCNDPVRVGNHPNDMLFILPVFHEGQPVAFIDLRAHQADIGGTAPGGFSATKANVYENGLVIAPQLMFDAGEPVRPLFSLIFDNSRFGQLLLPDFMSIRRQLQLGERLVLENIERYGLDAFLGTLDYACDTSAERMREAIEAIPDGVYTGSDVVDADGVDATEEYRIQVTLRKRGSHIEADLSGTSRQARTCINASALDAKTTIGLALSMLLDPTAPFTSGTWRDIDVVAPPGTCLTAMPPDGAVMMFWEVTQALLTSMFAALDGVLGDKAVAGDYGSCSAHTALGVTADGTPWVSIAECGGERGPWGATNAGDGDNYTILYQLNLLDTATEAIEHGSPVVVLRKESVCDTGGPGFNRGGAGAVRDALWLTDAQHYSNPLHTKTPSGVGANGGRPGAAGGVWFFPEELLTDTERSGLVGLGDDVYARSTPVAGMLDPETKAIDPAGVYHYFASQRVWNTSAGSVSRYLTNAGGGWGSPRERDPERVKRDVRDGYVSIEGARRDYGVVVTGDPDNDPEGLVVDQAATRALRTEAAG